MTIEEERAKLRFDHELQVRRIIYDKVILGLLIAVIAFFGTLYIEGQKAELVQQKFLLENRLSGLKAIRKAYSVLTRNMLTLINKKSIGEKVDLKDYMSSLKIFGDTATEWGIMFSPEFDKQMQYHAWIHDACARGMISLTIDHYGFASDMFESFDKVTHRVLWQDTFGRQSKEKQGFQFARWNYAQMKKKGGEEFFEQNYKKWKESQK